jgi:hypothetical protein
MGKFEESKKYGRKCLRLAVYLKDRNSEFRIIENFKIINYYMGVIVKYKSNFISD